MRLNSSKHVQAPHDARPYRRGEFDYVRLSYFDHQVERSRVHLNQKSRHLEELGERDVVEAIRTVEDHTLLGYCFGKVLGRLGFTRACRSFRGTTCRSEVNQGIRGTVP